MSAFEFVLVSFAIVIGFGVSAILDGWGDQIRARHRLRLFPLQIASSAFVLYFSLQYLWILWQIRHAEWTFPLFLAIALPALALSLAGQVSKVDTSTDAAAIRDQYFQNSPVVYSLLAVFPVLVILMSFTSGLREIIPNPPDLVSVSAIRVAVVGLYAAIACSRSERFHWLGLTIVWIAAFAFMARMAFRLSESTA